MKTIEAILSRRSIRQFTNQPVSAELVDQLLEAAMQAPSARNTQPWHFVCMDDRKLLNAIPHFHPYAQMLGQAPLAIVVCGDTTLEGNIHYLNQNCSAATQNILLAAHALGLGAVWLGIFPREQRVDGLRELLKLPETILPISLVALGYPAEHPDRVARFKRERIHRNGW